MKLTKAQRETAKSNNIPLDRAHKRIDYGWDVETAITKPLRKKIKRGGMTVGDKHVTDEQIRVAEENGISKNAVRLRLYKGMRILDAITMQTEDFPSSQEKRSKYTAEEKALAASNGVSLGTLHQRVWSGWDKQEALTTPVRSKARRKDDGQAEEQEALARIARTKYLNRTEFRDDPMPYMKSDLKKLSALGISVDEVEEIEA